MTCQQVLLQLESMGSDAIKKVLTTHGAREPLYGVKVENMKKIVKVVKTDYQLSLALYDTGITDAMYLAGLIADSPMMTVDNLNNWVQKAYWSMLAEYTVPWVAAESNHAIPLAMDWIASNQELVAVAGWSTLGSHASITADSQLDIDLYRGLCDSVARDIHTATNRVKQSMNSYLISTGVYITALTPYVITLAHAIGHVKIDMSGTACKIPAIDAYIRKVEARGSLGKKRKTARC
jgi:3-methyladenine DNA glycosylase AlkD